MSKKGTNDQQHIMDALDKGNYDYVWEHVKFVGFKEIPDIYERYSVFCDIVKSFDTEKNNNFIQYYKSYLKYAASNVMNSRIIKSNGVLNQVKTETISPTDCKGKPIVKNTKNWHC